MSRPWRAERTANSASPAVEEDILPQDRGAVLVHIQCVEKARCGWLVTDCLTSRQRAGVSQGGSAQTIVRPGTP